MDARIVFDNRVIDEVDGSICIADDVMARFKAPPGWTRKSLRTAWDCSKKKRTKFFAGGGNNVYDPEAAEQWNEKITMGIYETPISLEAAFQQLPTTKVIFEKVKHLLGDWDFNNEEELEAIQLQIVGYEEGNGIAPHNDFPGGFVKSMVLITDQDGYLEFGRKKRGEKTGKNFDGLRVKYNKGDCILILYNGPGDKGWKHSVDGQKHKDARRINLTFRQVNTSNRLPMPQKLKCM